MFVWLKKLRKTRSDDAWPGRTQAIAEKIQELDERVRILERDYSRLNSKVYRDINRQAEVDTPEEKQVSNPLTNLNPGDILPPGLQL